MFFAFRFLVLRQKPGLWFPGRGFVFITCSLTRLRIKIGGGKRLKSDTERNFLAVKVKYMLKWLGGRQLLSPGGTQGSEPGLHKPLVLPKGGFLTMGCHTNSPSLTCLQPTYTHTRGP